jgi:dethiobiotin synthetase
MADFLKFVLKSEKCETLPVAPAVSDCCVSLSTNSTKMKLFITGIGTSVVKPRASPTITDAHDADNCKPIPAGDLHTADSQKIAALLSNEKTVIHPNSYALNTPASPHLAAERDGITIDIDKIKEPETHNHLVIEGAGGIFVPLNETQTVADLIQSDHKIIVVSRHYLGSINHTLLTIEALQHRKINIVGIIFNGDRNESSEKIILHKTGIPLIGHIDTEPYFDKNVIADYADQFRDQHLNLTQ